MQPINEGLEYPGVGVRLTAFLDSSRAELQIDVSFGNVITPAPVHLSFPKLLMSEAVQVAVYPLETVVTEKFAALVERGVTSTRMKDLYDLHVILRREAFEASVLRAALSGSFAARGTPVRDIPVILGHEFAADAGMARQWGQYLRRTRFTAPSFPELMAVLNAFFGPILLEDRHSGTWQPGHRRWA